MATQEQALAQEEIDDLKAAVLAEQQKLVAAKADVDKAGHEKAEILRRCQQLEKEQVEAKQVNKILHHDLESMITELEDSKNLTVQLREKYDSCKEKVQTINEKQSRRNEQIVSQFDKLIQDVAAMRKEGDTRVAETEKTIWENCERTEKLAQEVCDFRNERSHENERNDIEVQRLRDQLHSYQNAMQTQEMHHSILLGQLQERCSHMANYESLQQSMESLATNKVEWLQAQAHCRDMISTLCRRADLLGDQLTQLNRRPRTADLIKALERNLAQRLGDFIASQHEWQRGIQSQLANGTSAFSAIGHDLSENKRELLCWLGKIHQASETNYATLCNKLAETTSNVKERTMSAIVDKLASTDCHLVKLDEDMAELAGKVNNATQRTMQYFVENTKAVDLLAQLESEKKTSDALRCQLQQREAESEEMEAAATKLKEGFNTIEVVRNHLENMERKLAETGLLSDKLDSILRVSTVIQETSSYLTDQSGWVNQLLPTSNSPVEVPGSVTDSNVPCSISVTNDADNGGVPSQHSMSSVVEASHHVSRGIRRVIVNSPTAPQSPHHITVEQEQIQRRQGSQLKPILRGAADTSRPKKDILSKPEIKENGLIGHIRTNLAGPTNLQRGYPFPTVAEFMKSSLLETKTDFQGSNTNGQDV